MQPSPRTLELLAPARDCEVARQAIIHGADAVYIGAEAFGARAAATNTVDDIARLVEFAHGFNARVYVTLNTIIYDSELDRAESLADRLYHAGVDALIVQDMSLLRMNLPPIALHASTQCDTRTAAKARFLEECGFSRIVLARELSLPEIKLISDTVSVPLEAFVHGAICVCYSGDCQASLLATGRSSNRGECAQMCRLPYDLTDSCGRRLAPTAHYLSLRDMMRIDRLSDMADAGISSFKIEGRLKESDYVRNTVAAYSRALDRLVAASDGRYRRASSGRVSLNFEPDVNRSFNRRFTSYFLDGRPGNAFTMASHDTPKWIGEEVATVIGTHGSAIRLKTSTKLNNGDGLGYFNRDGLFCGFRVNRAENDMIYPAYRITIEPGTKLFRNRDKQHDDIMAKTTATRHLPVSMTLRRINRRRISLCASDEQGVKAELVRDCQVEKALRPQTKTRRDILSRLGDTIYRLDHLDDKLEPDDFIPASVLTALRRDTIDRLDVTRRMRYAYVYRRQESKVIKPFKDSPLDYHDNVANRLAKQFYESHGIIVGGQALETSRQDDKSETRVMTTRYCLRRELGVCLRSTNASRLPSPLFLQAPNVSYRLDFDCRHCEMHVIRLANAKGNARNPQV